MKASADSRQARRTGHRGQHRDHLHQRQRRQCPQHDRGRFQRGRGELGEPNGGLLSQVGRFKPPTNNTPLRDGKGKLYEGGIRVPLMVRWPSVIAAGTTNDTVVGCIDVIRPCSIPSAWRLPRSKRSTASPYAAVLRGTGTLWRENYSRGFPTSFPGSRCGTGIGS